VSAEEGAPTTLPVRGKRSLCNPDKKTAYKFIRAKWTYDELRTRSRQNRARREFTRARTRSGSQFGAIRENAATINPRLSSRPALDDDAGKFPRDKRVARIERAGSCEKERYTTPACSTYGDTMAERIARSCTMCWPIRSKRLPEGWPHASTILSPSLPRLSPFPSPVSELIRTWRDATKLFAPELDSSSRQGSALPRTSALDPEGSAVTLRVSIEIIPFARYRRIIRRLSREVGARIAWHPAWCGTERDCERGWFRASRAWNFPATELRPPPTGGYVHSLLLSLSLFLSPSLSSMPSQQ